MTNSLKRYLLMRFKLLFNHLVGTHQNKVRWRISLDNLFYILNKVENYQPIISVDEFFTETELDKLSDHISKETLEAGLISVDVNTIKTVEDYDRERKKAESLRKCNIAWLSSAEYTWVYDKINIAINHINLTNFNKVLYGIQPLQYCEYDSTYDGFLSKHSDVDDPTNKHSVLVRSLSFTLQLSKEEEYTGGDVLLYHNGNILKANRKYGTITFFDSSIVHEVTPVTSGIRKSVVGWILGPRV